MPKNQELDMNKILLKAHKLGVKKAIETAARTNTSLVVFRNGKIQHVKPPFKYVRVAINSPPKKVRVRRKTSLK